MNKWIPWALVASLSVLNACGPLSSPTILNANPKTYLLKIDQLSQAAFYLLEAAHDLTAKQAANSDPSLSDIRVRHQFNAGTQERFFRDVGSLITANGPIDVVCQVEEFATSADAIAVFQADITPRDSKSTPFSTGPLGDGGHANELDAPATNGVTAAQFTIEWHSFNLLATVIVRGRQGGVRLSDALEIANQQNSNFNK